MKALLLLFLFPATILHAQGNKISIEAFASLKKAAVYDRIEWDNTAGAYSYSLRLQPLFQVYGSYMFSHRNGLYLGLGLAPSSFHIQYDYTNSGATFSQDLKVAMIATKLSFGGSQSISDRLQLQLGASFNYHRNSNFSASAASSSSDSFTVADEIYGPPESRFSFSVQSALRFVISKNILARLDLDYDLTDENPLRNIGWEHEVRNSEGNPTANGYTRFIGQPKLWYIGIGVGIVLRDGHHAGKPMGDKKAE